MSVSVLHDVVESGQLYIVDQLLNTTNIGVNRVDPSRGTPLHVAVNLKPERAVRMCELLIHHGADISLVGRCRRRTPLHAACARSSSRRQVIELLVDRRTIHKRAPGLRFDNAVPHEVCIQSGNLTALKVLLEFEERNQLPLNVDDAYRLARQSVGKWSLWRLLFDKLRRQLAFDEEGWGFLLRMVVSAELSGKWTEMLLNGGANPIPAISHVLRFDNSDERFELLLRYVTRDAIERLNASQVGYVDHPVSMAIKQSVPALRKLLSIGVEFSSIRHSLSVYDDDDECFINIRLCRDVGLKWYDFDRELCDVVLHLQDQDLLPMVAEDHVDDLASTEDNLRWETVIEVLLQHGASVNAESDNELPPLSALALKIIPTYSPDNPIYRILRRLLSAGADPFHTRIAGVVCGGDGGGSSGVDFSHIIPDALLIAAMVGNENLELGVG